MIEEWSAMAPHSSSLITYHSLLFPMPALLVVDDESSILTAFRRAYRNHEMTVLTAETAAGGLAIAREQHPDVIIFDIQLPDMSGLDALRQLRAIDARSPVIFITG